MQRTATVADGRPTPVIVAFEGLDGTGKTTVAGMVAGRLGVPMLTTPPLDMRLSETELLRDVGSPARYLYYLAAAMRLGEQLAQMRGGTVVLDRYVDSVHAMHAPRHPELAATLREVPIRQPDLVLLLEVGEATRRQRLAIRSGGTLDPFERSLLDDDFRLGVQAEYRRRADAAVVDTTELSIDDVVDRCIAEISAVSHNRLKTTKNPR